jgi:hypothetical protein
VVAVSCNVTTFAARRASILIDWRLQDRRRDAGRSVPPHAACGIGGEVQEIAIL